MKSISIALCVLINLIFSPLVLAQETAGGGDDFTDEGIKDISTIAGLGAGGAILGLSTLSFVEEPGDHLKNVLIGTSIGIILGVAVVAWSQATKSKDLYDNSSLGDVQFRTYERVKWHMTKNTNYSAAYPKSPKVHYVFSF